MDNNNYWGGENPKGSAIGYRVDDSTESNPIRGVGYFYCNEIPKENIFNLTKEQKEFIRIKRNGASWRRLAEIVHDKYPELGVCRGNQIDGMELCKEAGIE